MLAENFSVFLNNNNSNNDNNNIIIIVVCVIILLLLDFHILSLYLLSMLIIFLTQFISTGVTAILLLFSQLIWNNSFIYTFQ